MIYIMFTRDLTIGLLIITNMKYILKNKEIELTQEEVQEIVKQNTTPKGIEIKNRFTGDIIFSSTKDTMKEAVEEAVESGANLYEASLNEADLRGAYLSEASLNEANLYGANLSGADLRGAEMQNAKFYGKGGETKINKDQVEDFHKALGIVVTDK